ncbi:tetratricopeptide repeat protein [Candidatus Gottesmanbacteria bacterium]|nr:tetratricopeptide repeat protein [Candidatus Gottesmanbacteria bacterium]
MKVLKEKTSLLIFVTAFLVYSVSLGNQFLWDDEEQIVANPSVHSISKIPNLMFSGIVNSQSESLSGGFYRPIVTITYTVLYSLGNGSPFTFRLFQITLNSANAVLVFLIFSKFFDRKLAFLGSIFFALHPGISEAVLFIAGLGEPLFTFFLLLAFYLYLRNKIIISLISFFIALVTKETAIIFMPLIFIYQILIARKINKNYLLGIVMTSFLYLLLRLVTVGLNLINNLNFPSPIAQIDLLHRIFTIPYSVIFYLMLFIYPVNLAIQWHQIIYSIPSLLVIILLIFLLIYKRKNKLLVFFSLWFVLGIIPVLNLFPLSATVAERWLYFSSVGLISIVLLIVKEKKFLRLFLIFIIILLGTMTIIRETNWKNGISLYANDVKVNPNSFDLVNNYGVELFRLGKKDEAKEYFERSIELNPKWWTAYNNLGVIYENHDDSQKAIELYRKSIDNGNYYLAYENLARLLIKKENYDEANKFLEETLKYYPQNSFFHYLYAVSLYKSEKQQDAIKHAQIAFNLNPTQENYQLLQGIMNKQEL